LATENVALIVVNCRGVGSTDARSDLALVGDEFPVEGVTILFSDIAFINSRSFNITSKNEETLIINLRQRVVVTGLWNVTGLLHLTPRMLVGIKFVGVSHVFEIILTTKNDNGMPENSGSVMRDVGRDGVSFLRNWLPSDAIFRIIDQLLYAIDTKSPHIIHWALLDVSSTVNIKIVIDDPTAVI